MSDTLKDDPLDTLERLLKEATQEPWAVNPFLAQIDAFVGGEPLAVCRMLWPNDKRTEAETLANTELMVHLRNLAPALLEVVKAARALKDPAHPDVITPAQLNAVFAALRTLEVKP